MYENGFLDDFSGYGGLPAAAAQPSAPAMTPELLQQIQQGAALAGRSPLINAAGGLSTLQPGALSPLDPLYNYAKTAPILSLTGNKEYENLNFQALPDTNYRLTIGGQVVGSASTPEEVARLVEYANSASKSGGAKVDVRLQKEVQTATPEGGPSTAFADVYANQPNNNGFLDVALPAALAAMGAGVIGLPGAFAKGATALVPGSLGAGLGAAGGMFAGSLGTGASLETALTKAAIAGLTAGGLSGLSGAAPVPGGTAPGLDIAINAPVAGLGGGVMSLPAFAAPTLSGLGGAVAGSVPGEILVQAARNAVSPALSGLGGAALSTGISNLSPTLPQVSDMLGSQPTASGTEEPGIVVSAARDTFSPGLSGLGGAALGTGISNLSPTPQQVSDMLGRQTEPAATEEPEIVVSTTGNPPLSVLPSGALTTGISNLSPTPQQVSDMLGRQTEQSAPPDEEIVVSATGNPPIAAPAGALAAAANAPGPENAQTASERAAEQPEEQAKDDGKGGGLLSKIDPVRLGISGLVGLVSALTRGGGGGGGGSSGNAGAGTRASLDPIFSAKLPAPSPQYSSASFAPRDMSGVDFARYGYGPAQSFFENVPRNPEEYRSALAANAPTPRPSGALNLPPVTMPQTMGADPTASITSLIRTYIPSATDAEITEFLASDEGKQFQSRFGGTPVPRARGGAMRGTGTSRESYAVRGPGSGRSDEIPALLSDGEYVIDAETVALLGDGSSEKGAKRFDDLRVKIRKHKGRNLAKGKFSANAKRPEKYLAGGRAQ
jgi:hypothetical protein